MTETPNLAARRPRGLQDRLGAQVEAEEALIKRASDVYERWGFRRLDTPAFEYTDALGKYLPDVDRPNAGVFSFQDEDEQWMSLRYDLTAPLARYVAEHWNDLPKPFRRWQAGSVWRNEKPGPGRFRQFTQCDADSVGVAHPAADAEMIMMAGEALEAIGAQRGEYCIKINTRRLLNGLLDRVAEISKTGVEAAKLTVLRAVDKLDRLGPQGVSQLLGAGRKDESGDFTPGANLPSEAIDLVLGFVSAGKADRGSTLAALENIVGVSSEGRAGLDELKIIEKILDANSVDVSRAAFDPSIVRGLEYYTGPVFEAHLDLKDANGKAISFGSVGGGGRYDDLVSRFRGESVPATGFSIGVSRLLSALEAAGRPLIESGDAPVVIIAFDKNDMGDYFALAGRLRSVGIGAEVYLGESGMKAQMKYADRRGAPLAIFFGENEKNAGRVTIKDLRAGKKAAEGIKDNEAWRAERPGQVECALADLAETAKRMLSP